MKPPVSVILIREYAEQLTGGGCCGGLSDDDPAVEGRGVFEHVKQQQHDLGVLHRTARQFFPTCHGREQVALVTVDPRNQLYLAPKLAWDVLRYRPGWRAGLKTALQLFSLPAVVVNGRIISRRNEPLDPDTFCHAIRQALPDQDRTIALRSST